MTYAAAICNIFCIKNLRSCIKTLLQMSLIFKRVISSAIVCIV